MALLDDEHYRETLIELSERDDENKMRWLEKLVAINDPIGLKLKAEAYMEGKDIERNVSEALKLFIAAGTSRFDSYNPEVLAEALFQAGNIFYTGEGEIQQDYRRAFKYYAKATADMRYIKAHVQCGIMYYYGLGVRKNFSKAASYFLDASTHFGRYPFGRQVNTIALEFLGRMLERGEEFKKNLNEAYNYYEAAAKDTRNYEVVFKLAEDYFYGINVAQDVEKAIKYYEEAGRYESYEFFTEANLKLAWIYELGENVEKNLAKADEYWAKLPPEYKPARA